MSTLTATSVKYNNDLNKISLKNWNYVDMNIFFTVISNMKNKGAEEIIFSTSELRTKINFTDSKKVWKVKVTQAANKIMDLKYYENTEQSLKIMSLFESFEISQDGETIKVITSRNWEYILNNLDKNFTSYSLVSFLSIKSAYLKNLYRLLKQWRTVGKYEVKTELFKQLLSIPESYTTSRIKDRILNPAIEELSIFFPNLKWEAIKSNAHGNPIEAYKFTWTQEQIEVFDENKYKSTTNELLENIAKIDGIECADLSYIQSGKFPEDTKYKFTYMQDGSPCLAIVSMKSFKQFHLLNYFVVDAFGNLYHRTNDSLCNYDKLIGKIELSDKMKEELIPRDKEFREYKKKEEQETKDLWAAVGVYD